MCCAVVSPSCSGHNSYQNLNQRDFWYSSVFGVTWLSNLGCSTFGKRILPLTSMSRPAVPLLCIFMIAFTGREMALYVQLVSDRYWWCDCRRHAMWVWTSSVTVTTSSGRVTSLYQWEEEMFCFSRAFSHSARYRCIRLPLALRWHFTQAGNCTLGPSLFQYLGFYCLISFTSQYTVVNQFMMNKCISK